MDAIEPIPLSNGVINGIANSAKYAMCSANG